MWVISYTVVAPILKSLLPSRLQRDWIEYGSFFNERARADNLPDSSSYTGRGI